MRALLFTCWVILAISTSAQERYGISHGNFGPTDASYLNPARSAGQWVYADIRLIGADVFAWNSLVAWSDRQSPLLGEVRSGLAGQTSGNVVLRSQRLGTQRAFVHTNVLGPAVSLSLGRGTIGAGVRSRVQISGSGISGPLGNFIYQGLDYAPQQGVRYHEEGLRLLGAAWTEFGVNYAHILFAQGFAMVSAGANVRYNMGHAAGAFQFTDLDFTVVDSARLDIHNATAGYGFADPAMNAGRGWGVDIGMNYERTLDEVDGYRPHQGGGSCTPARYRYRIGVSLLDLGGIRFREAQAGRLDAGALSIANYGGLPVNDVNDLDSLFGSATQWSRSQGMSVGLPTAISMQYDQRVADHTYIAFAAIQGLAGRNTFRLRRSNSISITPRFETRYFEAAMPVVLHEYQLRPSIGAMLRFNGLVIGTDHIMPFIGKGDVYAMDLYMRLRIMLFRSPACKGKRAPKHRSGSKDMVPCATPND